MKYIVHRYLKCKTLEGNIREFPVGTECKGSQGYILTMDNEVICTQSSLIATQHLAVNDDGNGLKRGKITWSIAYDEDRWDEENQGRFSKEELECIDKKWEKYKKPSPNLFFNTEFFHANIEDLEEMAKDLHVNIE